MPRRSSCRVAAGIARSTSSRTAAPKRRRRSSSSIAEQQVVRLVLLEREVGVAGDPEEMRLQDLHAREQRVEVGGDDLLDRHERAGLDLDEARQDRRHLDAREAAFPGLRIADADGQREAQGADVGERVARDRRRAASAPGRSLRGSARAGARDAPAATGSPRSGCRPRQARRAVGRTARSSRRRGP